MDLFGQKDALFSVCRRYRYMLKRVWDEQLPVVAFIGLNPSVADDSDDDRTIRRVIGFSRDHGFGALYMLNLFGWVTPYPRELARCEDPVGENDHHLLRYGHEAATVVFAWGASVFARPRLGLIRQHFPKGQCLAVNRDGSPGHPLFLNRRSRLSVYTWPSGHLAGLTSVKRPIIFDPSN